MRYLVLCLLVCGLASNGFAEEEQAVPSSTSFAYNFGLFKGLRSISVLSSSSVTTEKLLDKYDQILLEELKEVGNVIKTYLFDPKGFPIANTEAHLGFNIKQVSDVKAKNLPIIELDLSLMMQVSSSSTQVVASNVPVWIDSAFIQESEKESLETIRSSIHLLVKQLSDAYIEVNGKDAARPTFYVYYW